MHFLNFTFDLIEHVPTYYITLKHNARIRMYVPIDATACLYAQYTNMHTSLFVFLWLVRAEIP